MTNTLGNACTVQFSNTYGWEGAGLFTFKNGQVSGNDSRFEYRGTYMQIGNVLTSRVYVKPKAPLRPNRWGHQEFCIDVTGTMSGDTGIAIGAIGGTHLQLTGTVAKQA
jgi:hypothetical protein